MHVHQHAKSLLLRAVIGASALCSAAAAQSAVESLDGTWEIRPLKGDASTPWRRVRVPAAFETALGYDFDGVAEYRRTWQFAGGQGKDAKIFIRFAAVATHATVFVNDREVGRHLGGWTPFRCRVDEAVTTPGEQVIRVVVDERVGHNTQGFLPVIAPHFGGIWQSVTIEHHDRPAFDRSAVEVRTGFAGGRAQLDVATGPVPAGHRVAGHLVTEVPGSPRRTVDLGPDLKLPDSARPEPWSPGRPQRHTLHLQLLEGDTGRLVDEMTRPVEFCTVGADGRKVLLNGEPIRIRGMLHWGYEPPFLAPDRPVAHWRTQFHELRNRGFNLVKACLWVPPPAFFEAAAEVGLLVWQEYPAWHPDFSSKHLPDLLAEYDEFFRLDRSRGVIAARSLTCETGHGAEEAVVKKLYERCKAVTGAALVVDDSSWITWTRYHDFYDDHPYGNCASWLDRLRGFDAHIEKHGAKPLLLGEAIAADTWLSTVRIRRALGPGDRPWWTPWLFDEHDAFIRGVQARFGKPAAAVMMQDSMRFAWLARKYQIETFHRVLPDAGYVVSVIRDFSKARMGLFDDLGRPKWPPSDFAWHGDATVVLEDPRAIRALGHQVLSAMPRLHGAPKLVGGFGIERWDPATRAWKVERSAVRLESWPAPGERTPAEQVRRVELTTAGDCPNKWTFYEFPAVDAAVPDNVRVQSTFDLAALDWVEDGGRLLLVPGGKGALRSENLWFLRGGPYGPVQPPGLPQVPRDALIDLLQFDFDGPVFHTTALTGAMDLALGFWDSHDRKEAIVRYPLLAECTLGKGRLMVCSLSLDLRDEQPFDMPDGKPAPNPARAWLRNTLVRHLAGDTHSATRLAPELIAGVRARLKAHSAPLDGEWLLRTDPGDAGIRGSWQAEDLDDSGWMKARAGVHWEALGVDYTGVAWYRKHFDAPAFWQRGAPLHAVFEGVDDSYVLYVNGQRVAAFGDPKTGETVWLVRTHTDISPFLKPGKNVIALRVVDHQGAGGLHRPVFLTTADPKVGALRNE